jgi:hypothetical protein
MDALRSEGRQDVDDIPRECSVGSDNHENCTLLDGVGLWYLIADITIYANEITGFHSSSRSSHV